MKLIGKLQIATFPKPGHSFRILRRELSVDLQHAYHHLNFAWNARYISTKRYANLTDEDFAKWGKYPIDIEDEDLR